jgi:hypothetical protein
MKRYKQIAVVLVGCNENRFNTTVALCQLS